MELENVHSFLLFFYSIFDLCMVEMIRHEYLPTTEYMNWYNSCGHGLKVYQWCSICHEHAPCKHNLSLGEEGGGDEVSNNAG